MPVRMPAIRAQEPIDSRSVAAVAPKNKWPGLSSRSTWFELSPASRNDRNHNQLCGQYQA